MQELNKLVLEWAEPKGLLVPGCRQPQLLKSLEEARELMVEVSKANIDAVRLEAGDVMVTLCLYVKQWGENPDNYIKVTKGTDFRTMEKTTLYGAYNMLQGYGRLAEMLSKNTHSPLRALHPVYGIMTVLADILQMHGLTFEECYHAAYDKIVNRKGKKVDGVFIKEEDL